jgi:hypothetical protein
VARSITTRRIGGSPIAIVVGAPTARVCKSTMSSLVTPDGQS